MLPAPVSVRTSRRRFAAVLASLAALCCSSVLAGPSPARPEIDALLQRLQSSGCSFNRNGSWYEARDARAHLVKKLEYLEDRNLVQTTEQFIDRAATGSSLSGKPYLVRCGSAEPVESRTWLTQQLKALRGGAAAK
jgi:hypothetical protein